MDKIHQQCHRTVTEVSCGNIYVTCVPRWLKYSTPKCSSHESFRKKVFSYTRMQTTLDFSCSGLLQVWFGFSSLTTTWRQNPKQAHFFHLDYMLPLPLVTQKNWFMFFFFLVSSRISQQRSVSGLALLCVRNVRSSQDLAALWDYSAEQEKHERVSFLSEPREAFHPRMSNKHPPCLSVSRVWFPCVVPFSSVSQRFLCCCFVAL